MQLSVLKRVPQSGVLTHKWLIILSKLQKLEYLRKDGCFISRFASPKSVTSSGLHQLDKYDVCYITATN
jgi:hypothetical protein